MEHEKPLHAHIWTLVLKAATKKTGVAYNYVEADGGAHSCVSDKIILDTKC